jgi:hypothetical protein
VEHPVDAKPPDPRGGGGEGWSPEDWEGNDRADEAAKAAAKEADLAPEILARWSEQQKAIQAVWRLIAQSQVAHLAARPKRSDGTAAKSRKRKAPARPGRSARRRIGAGEVAEANAGPPALPADQGNGQAGPPFAWPTVQAVPGVHDFWPVSELVPANGWPRNSAGSMLCRWKCRACGQEAANSSRMFELLRKPCGDDHLCEWRQSQHTSELAGEKVHCTKCGTTRQRYIRLDQQKWCPVRSLWRQGLEDPAGAAVHAAWTAAVKAMHLHGRRCGGQPFPGPAVQHAGPDSVQPVIVAEPRALVLRPFRSHAVGKAAEAEFCLMCLGKAPRYKVAAWRAECCDGRAPVGSCPKHLLAAISAASFEWPARHATRAAELKAFARQWQESHALKALRPLKRRVAVAPKRATRHPE